MSGRLAYTTLLIDAYQPALEYFRDVLNFQVLEDQVLSDDKRWVVVAPSSEGGALLLARASTPEQRSLIGRQGGGRVWLFLQTPDFEQEYARMLRNGVRFEEAPREESYGRVAIFADRWGNRWDLIQPRAVGVPADPGPLA
jgi:catechol 2,3-dioxygenase-like lactoylglutathione lyase family enzyme